MTLQRPLPLSIGVGNVVLGSTLSIPSQAKGLVIFAHGSGSSRHSPRNQRVASHLQGEHLATLLFDLLTPEEASERTNVFDVPSLGSRLAGATLWASENVPDLPIGYFGASTGAAAALVAAAELGRMVDAVVSRGGRPDLAGESLAKVTAPTLLIVGADDKTVLRLNHEAASRMTCDRNLAIVPGATHLFEEPGTLDEVSRLAAAWFVAHLRTKAASSI